VSLSVTVQDIATTGSPQRLYKTLFIFGTQMKTFLMKSESFLSLHWQLKNFKKSLYF